MRLSILLVTQPGRVARLVTVAGLAALVAAVLEVGGHSLAGAASAAALVVTGVALESLSPLYGRTARVGLWVARGGVAFGALALLFPDTDATVAVRAFAAMLVVIGLQPVARRARGLTDLPSWTSHLVGVGVVAALLAPSIGGGAALALAWFVVAVVIRARCAAPGAAAARA
jgi:hypothetical protein